MPESVSPVSVTEHPASDPPPLPPQVTSAKAARRLFLPALYGLRVLATLNALLVLAQAWSMGQYLDGDYARLVLHRTGAGLATLTAMVLALVTVLYVLLGGARRVLAAVLLFFAEGIQTGTGYARQLGIHIPLGVSIVTLAVLVAVWSWSGAAARPRPRSTR